MMRSGLRRLSTRSSRDGGRPSSRALPPPRGTTASSASQARASTRLTCSSDVGWTTQRGTRPSIADLAQASAASTTLSRPTIAASARPIGRATTLTLVQSGGGPLGPPPNPPPEKVRRANPRRESPPGPPAGGGGGGGGTPPPP